VRDQGGQPECREMLAARLQTQTTPATAPAPAPTPAPEHLQAADAVAGGAGAIGAFLRSKRGRQLEKQVARGIFGLLKKRL
ncbi:MAG: hypothetical protein ACRDNS_24470, partial [Trebonia sp.]